jgi:hypothetical protein
MWMGMGGAMFIVPIALVYVFFTSNTPIADVAKFVIVVVLAMLGGVLGGLSYSAIGRRLIRLGTMGRCMAGIVTLAPYMFVLTYIIGFTKGQSLFRRPSGEDLVIAALMAVFFGVVMGRSWFGDPKRNKHPSRPAI